MKGRLCDNVLDAIGDTPLVRLQRLLPTSRFHLFAKLEGLNPGGSAKDRTACGILRAAIADGSLRPGMVVIESSSGNFAIGLAQACLYLGYRLICVVDKMTIGQNVAILTAYDAQVEVVDQLDPGTGTYLHARLRRLQDLLRQHPNSFWPNQYANANSAAAHTTTMLEIETALDGQIDLVFCATGTSGTLRGCAEYKRRHRLDYRLVAVDAAGSVLFGSTSGAPRPRLVPGHGTSVRPALFDETLADEAVVVTDLDCVRGCRLLLRQESILAGGSSGAVIAAICRLAPSIPDGSVCVVILADRGERYLDTIFSDRWVRSHWSVAESLAAGAVCPDTPGGS